MTAEAGVQPAAGLGALTALSIVGNPIAGHRGVASAVVGGPGGIGGCGVGSLQQVAPCAGGSGGGCRRCSGRLRCKVGV